MNSGVTDVPAVLGQQLPRRLDNFVSFDLLGIIGLAVEPVISGIEAIVATAAIPGTRMRVRISKH